MSKRETPETGEAEIRRLKGPWKDRSSGLFIHPETGALVDIDRASIEEVESLTVIVIDLADSAKRILGQMQQAAYSQKRYSPHYTLIVEAKDQLVRFHQALQRRGGRLRTEEKNRNARLHADIVVDDYRRIVSAFVSPVDLEKIDSIYAAIKGGFGSSKGSEK